MSGFHIAITWEVFNLFHLICRCLGDFQLRQLSRDITATVTPDLKAPDGQGEVPIHVIDIV